VVVSCGLVSFGSFPEIGTKPEYCFDVLTRNYSRRRERRR
jgi:hypothetical protein